MAHRRVGSARARLTPYASSLDLRPNGRRHPAGWLHRGGSQFERSGGCAPRDDSVSQRKSVPVTQVEATTMKSNVLNTRAAFLLLSFGAACGSSEAATDGATTMSAANTTGSTSATDSASAGVGGSTASTAVGGSTGVSGSGGAGVGGSTGSTRSVDLGTAAHYAILAKTGISTVPTSAITGDLGVSPAAASYITGFSLAADATNVFSTSPQVTGSVYASDYTAPTPSNLTSAIADMQLAFSDAAGRAPGVTELGAGNIGGMTLTPGVYKWGTGLLIPTNITLTGNATDVWIFQIAQDLTMSGATSVFLAGGALPKNIFWEVAGLVDLGTKQELTRFSA